MGMKNVLKKMRWAILLLIAGTLSFAFTNCGKVNIVEMASGIELASSSIDFKEVLVLVEVNHDKTVSVMDPTAFKGVLSLDQNSILLAKDYDKQGEILISTTNAGEVTFKPVFGYRGSLTVPVYIKYTSEKIEVIQITFQVQNPLQNFRPALAARAADCMLCHAKIRGDLISDFGYKGPLDPNGPDLFGRKNKYDANNSLSYNTSHNAGDPNTSGWMTASVNGNVLVPKIDLAALPALPGGEQRMMMKSPAYVESGVTKTATTFFEYLDKIYFADRTRLKTMKEKSAIYIGAPTEQEIKTAGRLSGQVPMTYIKNDLEHPDLSGFIHVVANGKDYYTNRGEMFCDGDLFVDGVVHLKDLKLKTENGCRLHATKTVFITGPIEYVDEFALSNLQITSSRAIYMGTGMCYDCYAGHYNVNFSVARAGNTRHWANSLRDRTNLDGYESIIQGDFLKVSNSPADIPRPAAGTDLKTYYDQQFAALGVTLVDANNPFDNTANTPFRRLLLNAPDVQSRYNGKFEGTIIAEFALWKLGNFTFQFDSVFTAVPIFPLMDLNKIIRIAD